MFNLNIGMPEQIMLIISKAMVMIERSWSTHFIGQNKYMYLWHWRLVHVSNAQVAKASKLIDNIDFRPEKEYNPIELFVDSAKLDVYKPGDDFQLMPSLI